MLTAERVSEFPLPFIAFDPHFPFYLSPSFESSVLPLPPFPTCPAKTGPSQSTVLAFPLSPLVAGFPLPLKKGNFRSRHMPPLFGISWLVRNKIPDLFAGLVCRILLSLLTSNALLSRLSILDSAAYVYKPVLLFPQCLFIAADSVIGSLKSNGFPTLFYFRRSEFFGVLVRFVICPPYNRPLVSAFPPDLLAVSAPHASFFWGSIAIFCCSNPAPSLSPLFSQLELWVFYVLLPFASRSLYKMPWDTYPFIA